MDLAPRYGPERPGDVKHSLAGITAVQEDLHYESLVDIKTGLKTIRRQRERESKQ